MNDDFNDMATCRNPVAAKYQLAMFPGAREAVVFRVLPAACRPTASPSLDELERRLEDPEQNATSVGERDDRAARSRRLQRARPRVRRFAAHNGLSDMWTLTYRDAVSDIGRVQSDMDAVRRALRRRIGRYPWFWVAEWHRSQERLHVHYATPRFSEPAVVPSVWHHGSVGTPALLHASDGLIRARSVADYMLKDPVESAGGHLYHGARGYSPEVVRMTADSVPEALAAAAAAFGSRPASTNTCGFAGPIAAVALWS